MIIINNSQQSEITIPVSSEDELEFNFTHHMSGQSVFISLIPTNPGADYFTTTIDSGKFKYMGLYSVIVKNFLQEIVYTTLSNVIEDKTPVPTYSKGIKSYELYQ